MISNEIKKLLLDREMTLTNLAELLGSRLNKNYSVSNLSQKLNNETISYKEIKIIAEILNYNIKFLDKISKY